MRKGVTPCLLVAVALREQRLLPYVGLVKRPFDLLLRRPEIGGELGPVGGLLLGGGFTPLLGFAERGFECEPGLVDGRRRARTGRALRLLRPECRGLLFSTRRRLRQGAFETPLLCDVPEGAQHRRTRVLDAPQRDRVDL